MNALPLVFHQAGQNGPPIVIVHGLFGTADNWLTLAKKLSTDFHVFLPDMRNHGRSPWSDEFSYEVMTEDLRVWAEQQALPPFLLIGHSMGGKIAMNFASLYPEKLAGLMIVDIANRPYSLTHQKFYLDVMASLEPDAFQTRTQVDEWMTGLIQEYSIRQFLLKNLYRDENQEFHWRINIKALQAQLTQVGVQLTLSNRFDKPTRFVRGETSGYVRDKDFEEMLKTFPKASIQTIENAGHWVHAEKPEEMLQEIFTMANNLNF